MEVIEKLAAIEEIKRLKSRYFRGVDTKDWSLLAHIFSPGIMCDYRGSATDPASGKNYAPDATDMVLQGSATVIEKLRLSLDGVASAHQGYCPDIEILSADQAAGVWGMHDSLRYLPGHPLKELRGYGYYHETYVRQDGEWRIATLRIERIRIDIISN